jgi:hypothetical protein
MERDEAEQLVRALEKFATLFNGAINSTNSMSNQEEAREVRSTFWEMMRCSYDLEELILAQHPEFRTRIRP